jgi:hypothetical protein
MGNSTLVFLRTRAGCSHCHKEAKLKANKFHSALHEGDGLPSCSYCFLQRAKALIHSTQKAWWAPDTHGHSNVEDTNS